MRRIDRSGTRRSSVLSGIIIGVIMSIAVGIILSAVTATLVMNGSIPETSVMYASYAVFLSMILTGVILSMEVGAGNVIVKATTVTLFLFFLALSINIIFFEGTFKKIWVYLSMVIIGIVLSCIKKTKRDSSKVARNIGRR